MSPLHIVWQAVAPTHTHVAQCVVAAWRLFQLRQGSKDPHAQKTNPLFVPGSQPRSGSFAPFLIVKPNGVVASAPRDRSSSRFIHSGVWFPFHQVAVNTHSVSSSSSASPSWSPSRSAVKPRVVSSSPSQLQPSFFVAELLREEDPVPFIRRGSNPTSLHRNPWRLQLAGAQFSRRGRRKRRDLQPREALSRELQWPLLAFLQHWSLNFCKHRF
ncbi:Uncharacterized protein Rs2_13817 [Raphanus sativus]|nr:Uncharacterized protein Rs2_13817 [Raphanus sativus]